MAFETKSGLTPGLAKGFHHAMEDVKPNRSFVVYSGTDRYPVTKKTEAISLLELMQELKKLSA